MSKVIIFSEFFPKFHPKAGQPTFFVEKIWEELANIANRDSVVAEILRQALLERLDLYSTSRIVEPKHHTIRRGHRWKVGDWFSPRVWSGMPYRSKQIQFAPDIQVKKVWNVEISFQLGVIGIDGFWHLTDYEQILYLMAANDGISTEDFISWIGSKNFSGQIICWNDKITY